MLLTANLPAHADTITLKTPRGAALQVIADFPAGAGPFAALVLAPGQGYPMVQPALARTAQQLAAHGVAVYRFDWAYFSAAPTSGAPSPDLAHELEDMAAVVALARAEPRVDKRKISVGGKSLGSVVAWRALAADASLRSGLFLTPICGRSGAGEAPLRAVADATYPGLAGERRPLAFIAGDHDPLCASALLYRFAAGAAANNVRVAVVGGDHSFENRALAGAAADAARQRNIDAVALLAADFVAEVSAD